MKKQKTNHVILWVIAITIGLLLNSCSSRKAEKQRISEASKNEIAINETIALKTDLNVKLETVAVIDDKTETTTTTKTWSPVDPKKPSSMTDPEGKKRDFNNSTYKEEETKEKKNAKTLETLKAEITKKEDVAKDLKTLDKALAKKASETINIDKSGFSISNWIWIIIFFIITNALLYLNHRFGFIKRVTSFFIK
jgi:flagellar hook protein FlgE